MKNIHFLLSLDVCVEVIENFFFPTIDKWPPQKGFMAHTNDVIMKTARKYLVVNWFLVLFSSSSFSFYLEFSIHSMISFGSYKTQKEEWTNGIRHISPWECFIYSHFFSAPLLWPHNLVVWTKKRREKYESSKWCVLLIWYEFFIFLLRIWKDYVIK